MGWMGGLAADKTVGLRLFLRHRRTTAPGAPETIPRLGLRKWW